MSIEPTSIQAVLFDYGLVLSGPPDPAAWERLKVALDASEEHFHAAYWRWRHDYDRGTLNGEAYWTKVATDVNRPLDATTLSALIEADTDLWTQPNPDMIQWAQSLQRRGFKTGILSNIGDAMEAGILARLPWLANFAHHTFSHRLLLAKPELEIYRRAAAGLGLAPQQILFIDDREENIAAAREAGMMAILYSDHATFLRSLNAVGLSGLLES